VKNGNVTLVGVVDSQSDKDLAGLRANTVPGVFHVSNDLQVAGANER
jgi:osmotically-inducible protein OsmY